MSFMTQLFTCEELATLNEEETKVLRDAVLQQIQTSPEINTLLRKMLEKGADSDQSA